MTHSINVADGAAVTTGIVAWLGYAPDVAAVLSAIYLLLRIIKYLKDWHK